MKRTAAGPPLLSVCLIVRNCELTLPGVLRQCLESIRARAPQAEVVVVDTMSSDSTLEVAREFADVFEEYRGPRGDWTREMKWFDDAAAARQRSFELASGKWRMWVDADDVLPGPEETMRLLTLNGQVRQAPESGYRDVATKGEGMSLEDVLGLIEKTDGTIDHVSAPYLYRSTPEGKALVWQLRERIVLWARGWKWVEPGHEVLVPTDGRAPRGIELPTLLYVHRKQWTDADQVFSCNRHYEILLGKYVAGDRSVRTLQYLCSFAPGLAPERTGEFVTAILASATMSMERYVARLCAGGHAASLGLYHDALEHFAVAKVAMPGLPNAYVASGDAAAQAEDWGRAAADYQAALGLRPDYVSFPQSPREHVVALPLKAAAALQQFANQMVRANQQLGALQAFERALRLAEAAHAAATGAEELTSTRCARDISKQLFEAQEQALALHKQWDFLRRHDESVKIITLLDAVPYVLEDHPIVAAIEEWARPLRRHLTDIKAYGAFYDGMDQKLAIPTHLINRHWLEPAGALPRAVELINWLHAHAPNASILELGTYDGIVVMPVLKACPGVRYTAVDANQEVLDRLMRYAHEAGVSDRLTCYQGCTVADVPAIRGEYFDVVCLFEVIEHVQYPGQVVTDLLNKLEGDGTLFMSTPWGAFDNGAPDESTRQRDPRGHVRAILPREMVGVVEGAGGRVTHLANCVALNHYGDTMHVRATHRSGRRDFKRPIVFVVPSALWDWNATKVITTGMGMSEEAIVYLARELAKDPTQPVAVYGPAPSEEVNDGVAYWPLEKMRHIPANARVVVSRCPSFIRVVEQVTGHRYPDAVLWLQDAAYPDLNVETAHLYKDIVVLTEWHRDVMHAAGVPLEQMTLINNFLLSEHFEQNGEVFRQPDWDARFTIPREPHHFVYASSPDRGLVTLLRLWPEVLKAHKDATLDIFYGWEGCAKLSGQNAAWAGTYKKLRAEYQQVRYQAGVRERGRVTHKHLAAEMMRAAGWLYPTSFAETGCCHGDTMISVPGDHRETQPCRVRILDLVGKSGFPLYVFDEKERRFRIGTAKWVKQTRVVPELVELELDDGSKLRLTDDHPVFNFDEEWVEAGKLKVGDRLTALHHRYNVMVKDADGTWQTESRLVGEWMAKRPLDGHNEHVNHLDPLRLDNRPESLEVLTASEHFSKTHKGKALARGHQKRATAGFKRWATAHPAELAKRNTNSRLARFEGMTQAEIDAENSRASLKAWDTRRANKQNHKIVAIRRIPGGPVFNVEVEEENCHNYVADGVVIHNCATAFKVQAAGAVAVATPYAGLAETGASPWTQWVPGEPSENYAERFMDGVHQAVELGHASRVQMARTAIDRFELVRYALPLWKGLLK